MKRKFTRNSAPRNCSFEKLEDRQHFSVYTVTSAAASGNGTLDAAILAVNADRQPGTDTIRFDIGNGGDQNIVVSSPLPTITHSVIIDGQTQNGDPTPIWIKGSGLVIDAGDSSISHLTISAPAGQSDITLENGNFDTVRGCYLNVPTSGVGVTLSNSSRDQIGTITSDYYSSLSNFILGMRGTGDAICIQGNSSNNTVAGNELENCSDGVYVGSAASWNTIISNQLQGNTAEGIFDSGTNTSIVSNDSSHNGGDGLFEDGTSAFVSGNKFNSNGKNGVELAEPSSHAFASHASVSDNTIYGNWANGVLVESSDNTVGTQNTIYDNTNDGILVELSASGTSVNGNSVFGNTNEQIQIDRLLPVIVPIRIRIVFFG